MTPDKNYSKKLTDQEVWMYHRAAICKAVAIGLGITIALACVAFTAFFIIWELWQLLKH